MTREDLLEFRSPAQKAYDLLEFLAREARMIQDPRIQAALRVIAAHPQDSKTVEEVTRKTTNLIILSPAFKRAMRDQNPFAPYPDARVSGPIRLGSTFDPILEQWFQAGLHEHELQQHMLLLGRAGSGKTNTVYCIQSSLLKLGIPFLAIDFKRDYRHLLRKTSELLVFNTQTFRFNPLRPPVGTDPGAWLQVFCDIFCETFFPSTSSASKNLLLTLIDRLYQEKGVYDGSNSYPVLADLDARLDPAGHTGRIPPQDLQRMYTIRNKTAPLVRLLGPMLSQDPGFTLQEMLQRNVVLEMDGLIGEYQEVIVNCLLHGIFLYRIASGHRGRLRHVLVFDEAKMVYAQNRATPTSYITRLTCMAREYGEAILACEQMPSCLGEGIKANVFTTLALSLSSMKDIQATAYAMGLDERQRRRLMTQPVGNGILRFADRYVRPFLIQIPRVSIRKDVSDAEVEEHMRPVLRRLFSSPEPQSHPREEMGEGNRAGERKETIPLLGKGDSKDLPAVAMRLLWDIRDRPYVQATERYRRLGLSARQGTKGIQHLMARDLLEEVEIPSGSRGRPGKYYQLTPKATGKVGVQKLGPGKGGLRHRFYQRRIQDYYTSLGYVARTEAYQNGKSVDVGVWKAREKVAIEIAMTPAHELANVTKDFQAGWDRFVICYLDASVGEKVKQNLGNEPAVAPFMDRIEFIPLRKFES